MKRSNLVGIGCFAVEMSHCKRSLGNHTHREPKQFEVCIVDVSVCASGQGKKEVV